MSAHITMSDHPTVGPQMDITKPDHDVEVELRQDGTVLWVNVDGVCRLRICQMPGCKIIDNHRT